ncbi:restriction endonuclease subunit S [Helicobacter pylori]|uniref:restriction endonuclease subunit S n=1 Tax=Helicobacter pylori TaxID=210 RepID=UPI000D381F1F|nr:restriction endonuclease subunit S [Helicobacter pylori]PUD00358.1 hypothetical protein C2S02_04345 [Helicobacter pylori]
MSEWQTFCLKDLGKIVGGATPSTNNPKNYGNKIAWITPKDLSTLQGRYIKKGSRSISRLGFKSCSTFLLPKHAILFSSRAPIGYVAIAEKRLCTNQGFKSIIPNKKIYFEFLYYLLKYHKDNISNIGGGTTFKEVSGTTLGLFEVKIPPTYYEQQKIARTLSILDQNGNFYVTHYDGKFDAYQRTYVVNPNNPNHYVLIYLFVKSYTNYLKLQSRGSIIKFITKSDIENIKIVLPNLKTYTKWNNVLKMIENNMQSTQTLTALRDFLLPLLLKQQVKPK